MQRRCQMLSIHPVVKATTKEALVDNDEVRRGTFAAVETPYFTPFSEITIRHSAQGGGMTGASTGYNGIFPVKYKRGWPGLFSGENQEKALRRALTDINAQGWRVASTVQDQWSFWRRLGSVLLAIITLGFVVRAPNVLLITEPNG